ncbi:hypothetical protein PVK06_027879 [Gossypium arboreum]|uniref:Uncharacterized protein n=1 Tax=Gossypium arboreum TaxID=29729 RepID=A0ABR0P1F0_GOSAR|nr:hypothetical protein PVK06_027879 [Gossypium arboreum]
MADFSIHMGTYFGPLTSLAFYTLMPTSMPTQIPGQMLSHTLLPITTPIQMPISMSIPGSILTYPDFAAPYDYTSIVTQTSHTSLFYHNGSSMQPSSGGVEDTRWEARMTPHSSAKEDDGDKSEEEDKNEHKHENQDQNEHKKED